MNPLEAIFVALAIIALILWIWLWVGVERERRERRLPVRDLVQVERWVDTHWGWRPAGGPVSIEQARARAHNNWRRGDNTERFSWARTGEVLSDEELGFTEDEILGPGSAEAPHD